MDKANKNIAIIYLVWLPYGIGLYKNFIHSYASVSAGHEHDLVFLFNGVKDEKELHPYFEYAEAVKIKYKYFSMKNGQDIEAYFWVSEKLTHTYILFLNSFSILLYNNWLKYYVNALELPGVGLVGATGSWQSHYTTVFQKHKIPYEFNKPFKYNFRKYKLFIKAFFYWRFLFSPFPNPHIRTTGFIIKRNLFSQLKRKNNNSKFDAYLFESGKKGITNQIINMGYQVLVVDKFSETTTSDKWYNSKTFWSFSQENLLILDNQTEKYYTAGISERNRLREMAWGNKY